MKLVKKILRSLSLLVTFFTAWLIRKALKLRAKYQISSLKEAIGDADKDKQVTGRKNIVVFNAFSGKYEPIQKKLLKNVAKAGRNTSNKAMTDGRKRVLQQQKHKKKFMDQGRVKAIEKKSLYVTE
jgi:hypothetical protein